ncbi:glutathione peroxidase [Methylolobus aquaticus]|nr:glutathione peroxidase [Methylolobus aquaticus]
MTNTSVYDFALRTLGGHPLKLADFRGRVLLIVNTASRCGFTPQYAGLERLHRDYSERGLTVIGVPCNQFGAQEPGDSEAIAAFCDTHYGVSFPLSEKEEVNGDGAHPLFNYLKQSAPGLLGTTAIKWNFTKFLVNRDGQVVARYAPTDAPESLRSAIERLLDQNH